MTTIPLRFETAHARTRRGMQDFYLARDRFLHEQLKRRGKGTPFATYKAPDGTPVEVWLTAEDLRHHALIVGATGTGKSSMLEKIGQARIARRSGVIVLDPHGDLFTRLAAFAIEGKARDLILVDLSKPEYLPSFNVLDPLPGVETNRQVDMVLGIIKRLYSDEEAKSWAWGVKANEILMWTLRALLESAVPASLVEIPSFLLLDHTRAQYLETVSAETRAYFETRFGAREEMYVSAVVNKLQPFLGSMAVQRFLGAATSSLNLFDLVDRGGTLLVNLAQGYLGPMTSNTISRFIVNALQLATLRRERQAPDARVPMSILIDEAQNLAGRDSGLADLLQSGRKFAVHTTLAVQELGLFPPTFRDHVLTNTGRQFFFRLPFNEAQALARDIFEPQGTLFRQPVRPYDPLDDPMLTPREEIAARTEDLSNLPRGTCYWFAKAKKYKARRITVHPPRKLPFTPGEAARRIASHMAALQEKRAGRIAEI
jgi:DNA helicase HerA-like ATPase